jgi:hypothetical protein
MKSISHLPILAGLLCVFAGPTLATNADRPPIEDQLKNAPTEIMALAKRGLECRRWLNVEISDAATDAMVARALDNLHCDSLDAEEVALRQKFAQSPPALRALDTVRDISP